ncbi:hypothetical protein PQX77_011388, partial [Marasmius sp. AFHP31]
MTEEIARLNDEISGRHSKKCRTNASSSTTSAAIACDNMQVDNEGGPGVTIAQPVSSSTAGTEARFTESTGQWAIPICVSEASSLLAVLDKSKGGNKAAPWRAHNYLRKAYNKAVAVPKAQRDVFQQFIVEKYSVPDFVKQEAKAATAGTSRLSTNGKSEASVVDESVAEDDPITGSSTKARAKGKKKATDTPKAPVVPPSSSSDPSFLKNTLLNDMLACISKDVSRGNIWDGIVAYPNGSISVRTVRALRDYYSHSPLSHHSVAPAHRHLYQMAYVELILTPGFYCDYVAVNPLPTPVPPLERYRQDDINVNLDDLTEFLRKQGITVSSIKDAALWAAHWLRTVNYNDIDSREVIFKLKIRLYGKIGNQGVPTGLNDNRYNPNGHIVEKPSVVIPEFPGIAGFNGGPGAVLPPPTSVPPTAVTSTATGLVESTSSNHNDTANGNSEDSEMINANTVSL